MEKLGLEPSEELMSSQDNSFLSPPAVSRDCAGPALCTGSGRLCRHQRPRPSAGVGSDSVESCCLVFAVSTSFFFPSHALPSLMVVNAGAGKRYWGQLGPELPRPFIPLDSREYRRRSVSVLLSSVAL